MGEPTNQRPNYTERTVFEQFNAVKRAAAAPDMARLATGPGAQALARSSKRRMACVELETRDGQVCVDLPLFFPDICIPLPIDIIPDGSIVQACIDVCFEGPFNLFPVGACVTVKFLGDEIVHECIGDCS